MIISKTHLIWAARFPGASRISSPHFHHILFLGGNFINHLGPLVNNVRLQPLSIGSSITITVFDTLYRNMRSVPNSNRCTERGKMFFVRFPENQIGARFPDYCDDRDSWQSRQPEPASWASLVSPKNLPSSGYMTEASRLRFARAASLTGEGPFGKSASISSESETPVNFCHKAGQARSFHDKTCPAGEGDV